MVSMLSSRTTIFSATLFLSLSTGVLTLGRLSANVIFNDLIKWNKTCGEVKRCREDFSNYVGSSVKCHCDRKCTFLGTCCADSKYRTRYGLGIDGFSCRHPNKEFGENNKLNFFTHDKPEAVFMIDRCKRNWNGEDFVQDLCLGDSKALNDPLLMVPVISPRTGIFYRNYFCFACNEDTESISPVFWRLQHFSISDPKEFQTSEIVTNLQYSESRRQWTIRGIEVSVDLFLKIPKAFEKCQVRCVESAIQTCAEGWTDLATKVKCEAYMSLVWEKNRRGLYRNPHCAICNFVDLSELECSGTAPLGNLGKVAGGGALSAIIREFYIDLKNRCSRYEMFDPFSNKCRRVRCGQNQVWYQGECRNRS